MHADPSSVQHAVSEPVAEAGPQATAPQAGKTVVIVNPFAQSQVAQGK
jgi:hypothetical protein